MHPEKAVSHRDLYAPKRFFSRNTAPKSHGRRQPCRGFLSCLAEKSISLECFAVLKLRFFLTNNLRGRRNTGCISRTMDSLWGKRFLQNRVNPYVRPPNFYAPSKFPLVGRLVAADNFGTDCRVVFVTPLGTARFVTG